MSRILVVDDESGSRLILKSRLAERGHEVVLAETGARGLVHAREQRFDAILVGASVSPAIDGFEVCRRLKNVPETSATPILLFADAAAPEVQARGYDAGCEAFLTGHELPTLEPALAIALRHARERRELAAQLAVAQEQIRRAHDERARGGKEGETTAREAARDVVRENGDHSAALRELASGRPDGILVVDAEGTVLQADKGACDLLGGRIEGRHLGHLVPSAGLEAFVRDAHIEAREGFRFDLVPRRQRGARSLTATVIPMLVQPGEGATSAKIVLFHDVAKRRHAAELLRVQEPGIPRQELGPLMEAARETYRVRSLRGESESMQRLRATTTEAIARSEPVLIRGERGTGKERIARTLHFGGSSTGAFVPVHCHALSAESLELELFGYAKGAFPGANADRPGSFHAAQDGTLYLEEIGEVPLDTQRRILAFLEGGTVQRRGSPRRSERLDVRVIASTSRPLEAAVREERFLADLLARLSTIVIEPPPLAGRCEDVEPIVRHGIDCFGEPRAVRTISEDALSLMQQYPWPGNVAELWDCVERACARATDGRIEVADLPRALREHHDDVPERSLQPVPRLERPTAQGTHTAQGSVRIEPGRSSRPPQREQRAWDITDDDPISLDHYEKKVLLRALAAVDQDRIRAAKLLGVGKSTLYRKLKRFGIH